MAAAELKVSRIEETNKPFRPDVLLGSVRNLVGGGSA